MRVIKNIGILWLGMVMLSSCTDWLSIDPDNKVLEDKLFEDRKGFDKALNGIYLELASSPLYGKELSCGFTDVLAQLYAINPQSLSSSHPYKFHVAYSYGEKNVKTTIDTVWTKCYYVIANCNNLLEQAEKRRELFKSEGDYNFVTGQAYAIRALLHFDVFRLWGPMYDVSTGDIKCIPYYTKKTDLPEELSPASKVVEYILADLDQAEACFEHAEDENGYRDFNFHIDLYAVKALKARVYLYAHRPDKAYEEVVSLLTGSYAGDMSVLYSWVNRDLVRAASNPDRIYYSEQLFCIHNSDRGTLYDDMFSYELDENQFMAPQESTVSKLFDATDYRYRQWKLAPGNAKDVSFVKFENINDQTTVRRNKIQSVLKLSEIYLIAAECAPTLSERIQWLDRLRQARGFQAGSVSASISGEELQEEIKKEYKREFYGEGQYFFYLKRTKETQLYQEYSGEQVSLTMGEAQYVLPLPDSEKKYRN